MLEKVQHRFTRMFPHLKKLPYEARLSEPGLWSLQEIKSSRHFRSFQNGEAAVICSVEWILQKELRTLLPVDTPGNW